MADHEHRVVQVEVGGDRAEVEAGEAAEAEHEDHRRARRASATVSRIEPFQMVCSQLRKSISAGTLMISVSSMKPCPSSGFMPVMNMWWP